MQGFKPVTSRFYIFCKFFILPAGVFQVISRCEEFEEEAFVALGELVLAQIKKELAQPHVVQAGYRSLQSTLFKSLYHSPSMTTSVSNYISRLLNHQDVKNFGKATAKNLLNKPWLKKLVLDTIDGYKKKYRIKEISPNSLSSK
jgi:hypothetical protein